MDERDFQLLAELYRSPFASFEAIGRKLDVSGTAAKKRFEALRAREVLLGFVVVPSAPTLGRHARLVPFIQERAEDLPDVRRVLAVEDVAWVARAFPATLVVMVYSREARPDVRRLAGVVGAKPLPAIEFRDTSPPRDPTLSPLDWRTIGAMLDDPRLPVAALAGATGLTARTVRRRRDALVRDQRLVVFPSVDTVGESGVILMDAYVSARDRETCDRIGIPRALKVAVHDSPPGVFLLIPAAHYADARQAGAALEAIDGVEEVHVGVPQGTFAATARIRAWVDEQRALWEARRGGVPAARDPH